MGRGRAKAKQTKVARELKYRSHGTDFDQLQRELAGDHPPDGSRSADGAEESSDDERADGERSTRG